jgi:hypothetical protein
VLRVAPHADLKVLDPHTNTPSELRAHRINPGDDDFDRNTQRCHTSFL